MGGVCMYYKKTKTNHSTLFHKKVKDFTHIFQEGCRMSLTALYVNKRTNLPKRDIF